MSEVVDEGRLRIILRESGMSDEQIDETLFVSMKKEETPVQKAWRLLRVEMSDDEIMKILHGDTWKSDVYYELNMVNQNLQLLIDFIRDGRLGVYVQNFPSKSNY